MRKRHQELILYAIERLSFVLGSRHNFQHLLQLETSFTNHLRKRNDIMTLTMHLLLKNIACAFHSREIHQAREKLIGTKGLMKEILYSATKHLNPKTIVCFRCEKNDWNGIVLRHRATTKMRDEFDSAHHRHHHVGKNHIGKNSRKTKL